MNADLQNGTVQAVVTIYPFQGQMLGEGFSNLGNPVIAIVGNQNAMDAGWVASASWAATHGKALADFAKAQKQALAWMKANKAGVARSSRTRSSCRHSSLKTTTRLTTRTSRSPRNTWRRGQARSYTSGQLKHKLTNKQVDALIYKP